MKHRILSLYLVGACIATPLIAQDETPTPVVEVEAVATPAPAPTIAVPLPAPALTPPAPPAVRKKGTLKIGDGEDGVTINFGEGDSEERETAGAPEASLPGVSLHEEKQDPRIVVLKNVVLPLFAILMVFGGPILIVALILAYRMKKHRLLHQTIASLVAAGQPIPPELLSSTGAKALPTPASDLRKGIILCMVGLGMIGFFLGVDGPWGLGCIPLAWGGGHLLTAKFAPRGSDRSTEKL